MLRSGHNKGHHYNGVNCPVYPHPNRHFQSYLEPTFNKIFNFQDVEEKYVSKIIKELPNKTSEGHGGISTRLLKTIEASVLKPYTFIINQSLETGISPQKLKIAKVSPIYKKVIIKSLHSTPSQYTDTWPTCRYAIHWCGTSHWNTQLPILMSWVRPDREILPRPSKHTSERSA